MKRMEDTAKARVLRLLETGEPLDMMTAYRKAKTNRLSEYISRLRRDGKNILTLTRYTKRGTPYGVYQLVRDTK